MILNEINEILKISMKSSRKDEVLAIRNMLEKIKKKQVDSQKQLDENEIIQIINKYAKQLRDSIKQFELGNRMDLVEKEKNELKIVENFLPQQLTREEINTIVTNVITKIDAQNMADLGRVIKEIMNITKGSADGKTISDLVREPLT